MPDEKLNVLYAEDEDMIRMLVTKFLSKHFNVMPARNGSEALDIFRSSGADFIVTDLTMPEMNGFELIKAVKELNAEMPVFVLTAHAEEYPEIDGAARIYTKPIDCKSMIDNIKEYLKLA